ncbi:TonB-dependent receptor [Polluticoccus soli]|uniref:TonB-dependent receptor n=1 Tax=Polluticoccus soli TaxID=3034150 RepID=UPI0023E14D64|nr:TonB-dependent receptor [Flavipsychrobacter sp. JY13-12]
MHRARWALAIMLSLAAGYVRAQSPCRLTLAGSVVETHNFEPVYPAVVYIDEINRSFDADESGKFHVDSLCAGRYTVHVHTAGYDHFDVLLDIANDTTVRLRLAHEAHMLSQVEVRQERIPTIIQSKEQMDKTAIAANSGKTLGDMLQSVNGVNAMSTGPTIAKPVIHGLHSNRIVTLNNGIRQEDQQWGGEHAPNIDPFLANNITVIKGAASVRYGTDAIGGVVLVEPAPLPSKPGTSGELNLAGFSNNRMGVASAMVEHNFKNVPELSMRLQGTFKKGGNYRVPGYWVDNTGVEERNYSAAAGWRKPHYGAEVFYSHFDTELGIYTGSHTGNLKDLEAAIHSSVPLVPAGFTYDIGRPKQDVEHDLFKAKLYADNRQGVWNLIYSYQHNFRQEYDIVRKDDGRAQLNLTLNTQTLNLNLDHKAIGGVKGQIGVDGIYQTNNFQNGDRLFIPTYNSLGGAAYLIERYSKNNWTLEAGVRYDNRSYEMFNAEGPSQQIIRYAFNYNSASATLGFRQQLKPNWQWSATLANAWRAPQANELFSAGFHHGAARIELGNKNLRPERSYNLNLETEYTRKKLSAEVSLYGQYIRDYIFLEPGADVLTIRGYFKTFHYRQTNAFLYGSDVSVGYKWTEHFTSTAKLSLLRARDLSANDWLILMPADRASLNVRYGFEMGEVLQECYVALNARYIAEQVRIPSNFDAIDYPRPPAAYFVPDAEAGTRLLLGKQPIYVSVAVTNMFNVKYRDYLDAFRYFIDQPGRNVVLRLRMPFSFIKDQTN